MTTDETIMSEMIERVVNRDSSDELAVQMFCLVVRSNPQMISKGQEMLISKIRSTDVTKSTRAIALLEDCMSKCGAEFQDEVSKFRFLNELIRLVSIKYQGDTTPTPIKQRIMECLLMLTTEFPQKTKIREAYDMLNKEGSVEIGNCAAVAVKRENVLGIDEEMLSKLINSNDPEKFKRANLLIQKSVNEDSRSKELILQHKSVLNEVENTVGLLNQMLDTYEKDGREDIDCSETMNLMRELYMSCKKHKLLLLRLPELIQGTNEGLVADTLETNDLLQAVMKRYKDVIVHPPTKATPPTAQTDVLSELFGVVESNKTTASIPNGEQPTKSTSNVSVVDTLDELREIFGSIENKQTETKSDKELLTGLDILQPVNVFMQDDEHKNLTNNDAPKKSTFRELHEIDKLSDELFKQNIQSAKRIISFTKREPEKLTLNDLLKEKTHAKPEPSTILDISLDMNTPVKKDNQPVDRAVNLEDDEILSANLNAKTEVIKNMSISEKITQSTQKITAQTESSYKLEIPQLHLSEIEIDLDELTPSDMERVLLDDDDIKITMNFTEDRPGKHVSVIVLAVSNKCKQALKNFQFEAIVKKPCKIRLLAPTDSALPPYKPYRPPTPINQVLLLLNPTGKDVDVTCIFGYTLGEDPDPIKESIVVKGISYVD